MQRTHPACGPQAACLRIFLDYQTVAGKDAREPTARKDVCAPQTRCSGAVC